MKIINLRWKIDRMISKDACGTVYLVKDMHHFDRPVLLKVFNSDFSKTELMDRLITDFLFLKSVKHPCLTALYEFDRMEFVDNKPANRLRYYYTYEYLESETPLDYKELSVEDSKFVFNEILRVVAYLHFRGIVYKYLNFTNMNIYKRGNQIVLKMNDLVFIEHYKDMYNVNDYRTSVFLPAEVVWNQLFDYSSDLYALGHILYYLHYRFDVELKSISEIYDRDVQDDNEINKLIRKMIGNYFEDRYYDMNAFMADYAAIQRITLPTDDLEHYNKLHFGTKLIGREHDFLALYNDILKKMDKKSTTIGTVLTGESGIGKTRLLREIAYQLKMKRIECYYVEGIENKEEPFYLFQSVLRNIIKHNTIPMDLIIKYGGELTKLIPEMASIWKVTPTDVLEGERELLKLANRLFNFIQDYSQQNPFVLIIDNMDQSNRFDLIVLDYLYRNAKEMHLYILVSANKSTIDENIADHLWADNGLVKDYQLNKFNYDDANQLIRHILGTGISLINFTARLMKEAEGNPRIIEEMIQNLYLNKKIYVGADRSWYLANIESFEELQFESDQDHQLINNLENMDANAQEILNIGSLFQDSIDIEILEQLLTKEIPLKESMKKMVDMGIFTEKFGDYGYTYNFNNRKLPELIKERLSSEVRVGYHKKIADILELGYSNQGNFVTEAMINHLVLSNQFEKAVSYCFIAAEKMVDINIYSQAISFYKRAMEIRRKNGEESKLAEILLKIGRIEKMLGQHTEATLTFEEASRLSVQYQVMDRYVDAINQLTLICITQSEITRAYNFYTEAMRISVEIGYKEGELQAALNLNKIQITTNDMEGYIIIAKQYIDIARNVSNKRYEGLFLNDLGIYESYFGSFEKALDYFNQSYILLTSIHEEIESMKPLNNMGVIYLEELADVTRARAQFEKVLSYYNAYNIIYDKPMALSNIGETYYIEGQYDVAMDLYNTAYKIAEEIGDDEINFLLLINICNTYIAIGEYDKAYLLIKKLEVDYQNNKNRGLDTITYYITHVEYFLKIKNFDMAERWLNFYKNSESVTPDSLSLMMQTVEFMLKHQKNNYLSSNKTVDIQGLKQLLDQASSANNIQKIRTVINDLAMELINARKFILVQELIQLETKYLDRFDSKSLRVKRELTQTYFEDDRIERFETILVTSRQEVEEEELWLIYKALGDEYFFKSNYFRAISNYMMAIDSIQKLCNKIPAGYRDSYILNDENKLDLKYRINELKRRIIGNRFSEENYGFGDYEVSSAEDYFNLMDIGDLYKNQKFLKTVQQLYFEKYDTRFEHVNDLIKCFQSDELYNIRQMLIYYVQYCFADRGFVILVDENGDVYETLTSDSALTLPDLSAMMKQLSTEDEGLIISFIEKNMHSPYLPKGKKGLICIPITKNMTEEQIGIDTERRKRNEMVQRKDRLGYIYLETDNIFNNFSKASYDHCKSLMNLLYVMIDNYNLKKLSTIDKLTGVYLRKYFEEMLSIELTRTKSSSGVMSLVMCDIDKFKSVNDTFGHRRGDEVLRRVGAILNDNFRASDMVGRYGGEEFIILLPRTGVEVATEACEKIRRHIESEQILGAEYPLTISFGISCYPDHGLSEEELIEKADQALYYSKNSGRNKTTLWNPNIGSDSLRFDKLAGIISGNMSKDTRNVQAMVTIMHALRENHSQEDRMMVFLTNLMDITEAQQGQVIVVKNKTIEKAYSRYKGSDAWAENDSFDESMVLSSLTKENGEYFINWNDLTDVNVDNGIPNWKSMISIPITISSEKQALLLLMVPIDDKEFDFGDYNYVNAMSGLLTAILK